MCWNAILFLGLGGLVLVSVSGGQISVSVSDKQVSTTKLVLHPKIT